MLNKTAIILLAILSVFFMSTTGYFYYKYNDCSGKMPVYLHDTVRIIEGTANIQPNIFHITSRASKIKPRRNIDTNWGFINESMLDETLERNGWFNFNADTALPEFYTAFHDTTFKNYLRITTSIAGGQNPIQDSLVCVGNYVQQRFMHPEGIFFLHVKSITDTLNVQFQISEKYFEKKRTFLETTEARYGAYVLFFVAGTYTGLQAGK